MSYFRSSPLLTPVGSGFYNSSGIFKVDHEKQKQKKSHPMDFSWQGLYDMYFKHVRNKYVSTVHTGTMGFICVLLLPTTKIALMCNIWQNTYVPIFPKTQEYPSTGYGIFHPLKYVQT